jgi:hypothetical protein
MNMMVMNISSSFHPRTVADPVVSAAVFILELLLILSHQQWYISSGSKTVFDGCYEQLLMAIFEVVSRCRAGNKG